VQRYQFDIDTSGCVQRQWVPGDWNTIADYGSRAVVADPAPLSSTQFLEATLFALSEGGETPTTQTAVVGHINYPPVVAEIIRAQQDASQDERSKWTGSDFNVVQIGQHSVYQYKNRFLIPTTSTFSKRLMNTLLHLAHDDNMHFQGGERTLWALQRQCRVHWIGIHADVLPDTLGLGLGLVVELTVGLGLGDVDTVPLGVIVGEPLLDTEGEGDGDGELALDGALLLGGGEARHAESPRSLKFLT
jgi:hypothetical protein